MKKFIPNRFCFLSRGELNKKSSVSHKNNKQCAVLQEANGYCQIEVHSLQIIHSLIGCGFFWIWIDHQQMSKYTLFHNQFRFK